MMEAVLSFLRRQVGLRTDSADASGSVHGKLKELRSYITPKIDETVKGAYASDTLKASADTEKTTTSTSYTKLKEIAVNLMGTVRVSYQHSRTGSGTTHFRVYINGVARGVERSSAGETWFTQSEDFEIKPGDVVQLWAKSVSEATARVRYFRLYYDTVPAPSVVVLN